MAEVAQRAPGEIWGFTLEDEMYHGICSKCMTNPAKHKVWLKFDNPQPYTDIVRDLAEAANVPIPIAPKGIWQFVCDDCQ